MAFITREQMAERGVSGLAAIDPTSIAEAGATSAATGAIGGAARAVAIIAIPWLLDKFRGKKKGRRSTK